MDFLRDVAARDFEVAAGDYFDDPWQVRNQAIDLVLDPLASREAFLLRHAKRSLSEKDQWRALALLEMQRNSLLMFTSCGWFFSEVSGIETIQVLKYAAKLIDLSAELGFSSPRREFLEVLAEAKSNRAEMGTGADIYLKHAERQARATLTVSDREATIS